MIAASGIPRAVAASRRRARRVGTAVVTPVDTSAGVLRGVESALPDITAIAITWTSRVALDRRLPPASPDRPTPYHSCPPARWEQPGRGRRCHRPVCQPGAHGVRGTCCESPLDAQGALGAAAGLVPWLASCRGSRGGAGNTGRTGRP